MNCRYCGTRLIPGAMFCGECGRSVAASAPVPAAAPLLPSPVGAPEFSHAGAEESRRRGRDLAAHLRPLPAVRVADGGG